jgi:hypothetical protein
MAPLQGYVERRLRSPMPPAGCVVPGSTPVISFGPIRSALVATLGLNPSANEFLGIDGSELTRQDRRLATHASLGVTDLSEAPEEVLTQIVQDCDTYFQRNPYWDWFGQLEPILRACGGSYRDNSACHLDVVQWATNPKWRSIRPSSIRKMLLDADAPFLAEQLRHENIRVLLINGMGAITQLSRLLHVELTEVAPIVGLRFRPTRLFRGIVSRESSPIRVFRWNTNIQSEHGVSSMLKDEIKQRIASMALDSATML